MTQPIVSNFIHQTISANQTIIHHPSSRLSWQVKTYKRPRNGKTEKLEIIYVGFDLHESINLAQPCDKRKAKVRVSQVCNTHYEVVIKHATWEELDDFLIAAETRQELWGAALRDPSFGVQAEWAGLGEFIKSYSPRKKEPEYELRLLQGDNIFETYSVIVGGEPVVEVVYHKVFQSWSWRFSNLPLDKATCIQQAIAQAKREKTLFQKYRFQLPEEKKLNYEIRIELN